MDQTITGARVDLDRAMKPYALPLGLASPMWMAYGAAATLGATWWWMSRMTRMTTPRVAPSPSTPDGRPVEAPPAPVAETLVAPSAPIVEPVVAVTQTLVGTVEDALVAPAAVANEVLTERPDELTLLRGVGPRVADALVARGVTTFAQLAAWTDAEMAAFDTELKLLGRSKRYDFLSQARQLAAED